MYDDYEQGYSNPNEVDNLSNYRRRDFVKKESIIFCQLLITVFFVYTSMKNF